MIYHLFRSKIILEESKILFFWGWWYFFLWPKKMGWGLKILFWGSGPFFYFYFFSQKKFFGAGPKFFLGGVQFFSPPPPPYGRDGGLTSERPGSGHVIWGPMRGLKKLNPMAQTDRQTDRRTWRLYDQLGPEGPSRWKVYGMLVNLNCHF